MAGFTPLCFVLVILSSLCLTQNNNCLRPCTCHGQIVDCRNTDLSELPRDLPSWVKILDLSSNKLNESSMLELKYLTSLTELKLNRNAFKEIPLLPESLISLSILGLTYNEITSVNGSILSAMPNLHTLDLSSNHIKKISTDAFMNNTRLQILNLNSNWLEEVNWGNFTPYLHDLKLNKNHLTKVTDDIKNLRGLHTLELNRNKLTTVKGLAFHGLEQLGTLTMRRNNISILQDGAFWGLKNLTNLKLDFNAVQAVTKGWTFGLHTLVHLSLSHNHIDLVEPDCWSNTQHLSELDLSYNRLKTLNHTTLAHLSKLKKLVLNMNRISVIEEGTFSATPVLEELELNGNLLARTVEDIPRVFAGLGGLHFLKLASNSIGWLSVQTFVGLDELQLLDLSNNSLVSLQENPWANMTQLRTLRFNSTSLLCDCSLGWFPKWLRARSFETSVVGECVFPALLKGQSVFRVAPDDFSCNGSPKPYILESPTSQMVLEGGAVTLHCRAASSSEAPMTFRWRAETGDRRPGGNEDLTPEPGIEIRHRTTALDWKEGDGDSEQSSELRLSNVTREDAGLYQCIATNGLGAAYSLKANISVVVFPTFLKQPENMTLKTGSIARLQCSTVGRPPPVVSWQKDGGNDFPAARERRFHVMTTDDVFFITNVRPADMGVYSCMASNAAGVNVSNASLTVLEIPALVKPMRDKDIMPGEALVLSCKTSGWPKPSVTWRKDGSPLRLTKRHHLTAYDELLVILETTPEDGGLYECEVSNTLGQDKSVSRVTILPESNSVLNPDDIKGVIVITVVCCAVFTSVVWVVIIYQTRKRSASAATAAAVAAMSHGVDPMGSTPLGAGMLEWTAAGATAAHDGDSEHSNGKDSGTGGSDRRSHSHEDLLPPLIGCQNATDCDGGSDGEVSSPGVQRFVVRPLPPSVVHPQRLTNHDRHIMHTATVRTTRPSSYHCLPQQVRCFLQSVASAHNQSLNRSAMLSPSRSKAQSPSPSVDGGGSSCSGGSDKQRGGGSMPPHPRPSSELSAWSCPP